jgi:competence ComEA-like helix-hairpin-helix protein
MAWRSLARTSLFVLAICVIPFSLSAKKKPPEKPININAATSEELQQVPGIGPAYAEKILQMRKSYGAFKSVDDLLAIKGIGPKRLAKIRKYLVVGISVPKKKTEATGCSSCSKPNPPPTKSSLPKSSTPPVKKLPVPDSQSSTEPEEPSRF